MYELQQNDIGAVIKNVQNLKDEVTVVVGRNQHGTFRAVALAPDGSIVEMYTGRLIGGEYGLDYQTEPELSPDQINFYRHTAANWQHKLEDAKPHNANSIVLTTSAEIPELFDSTAFLRKEGVASIADRMLPVWLALTHVVKQYGYRLQIAEIDSEHYEVSASRRS